MAQIDAFFKLMNEQGASDLHLVAGQQPVLRIRGELERVKYKPLDNDSLKAMLYEIAAEDKIKVFEETGDVDFAYEIPGLARYRANFFQHRSLSGLLPCREDWFWSPVLRAAESRPHSPRSFTKLIGPGKTILSPLKILLSLSIRVTKLL
jgi:hypothetical protein